MKRDLRVLAAAGVPSFALTAAAVAFAQKAGGILKISHFDPGGQQWRSLANRGMPVEPADGNFSSGDPEDHTVIGIAGIKCDGQGRQRRASMKANQRAPAPARRATHSLGCAWHPSRGKIVVMDAQQPDNYARGRRNRVGSIRVHLLFAYVVARIVTEQR
jgi:hypothetical protein